MTSERSRSTRSPIPWAQPLARTLPLSDYRRRWACTVWLDRHRVLLGGMDGDSMSVWERLDIRTGNRRTETAFGPRLARTGPFESEYHDFEPVAASPGGAWLLGHFDIGRHTATPGILGHDGRKQTWDEAFRITGWLDGRRFLGWRRPSSEMCVFEVGRALPSTIRLRGLPDGAWLMGPTPRGTALLGHADYPHFTVYEAALESGARPHRRGRFRVHDGVCGVQLLSPRADRLVAWGADEAPDGRSAASLWVFDLTRWSVRRLGCAPWRASGGADDLGLTGINWHPDGRRVSFLYDDEKGCQLYLAHV